MDLEIILIEDNKKEKAALGMGAAFCLFILKLD